MNSADAANIRNTTPPTSVTEKERKKNLSYIILYEKEIKSIGFKR